jgi:Acyltransferase family
MSRASLAFSNLRATVIVIVVAFHASLAYLASTPAQNSAFDRPPYSWQAFPIVDAQRFLGLDIFCAWQDVSLMSLLFFLSGLFAAGSLLRKQSWPYMAGRLWRIGLPFLLAILFLSPPSYYPAYLVRTADPSLTGFWAQWMSLPIWPAGPQWFLWQLLAANALAAGLYAIWPKSIAHLGAAAAWAGNRPLKFFALLSAASVLAYVPLALAFSPWSWSAFGPFSLQLSRPAHYLVYFFAGLALGSHGFERGLLAVDGPLARRWWAWLAVGVASFALWAGATSTTLPDWRHAATIEKLAASVSFPLACAGGGFALLALSLRFASGLRHWIFDSLSANAYSIYLLHYVFVVWLQYALLGGALPAFAKVAIVFAGALMLSWTCSAAFGRVAAASPVIAAKRAAAPVPR